MIKLVNAGHEVGNLGYNYSYSNSSFLWLDYQIKKASGQKIGYCYHNKENNDALILCSINSNYSIIPSLIINDNLNINVKENLKAGDLISISVNDNTISELPVVINFINSKGFEISTLDKHLKE